MPWRVIERDGNIRIGLVTKGGVVQYESPTRYGTISAAKNAARANNERTKSLLDTAEKVGRYEGDEKAGR
jgi:hypothetical protein